MVRCGQSLGFVCVLGFLGLGVAGAAEPQSVEFFETKIRPVLVEACYRCHSSQAETQKKLKANLRLDSRAGWQTGGDTGPAIIPGKPKESLLYQTLTYDHDVQMPPSGKLPATVLRDFERWIAAGALDPRDSATVTPPAAAPQLNPEEARSRWPYHPLQAPGRTIDELIRAGWAARGLTPAAPADPATWLRRVTFDLTGLPPTREEYLQFLADPSPAARAKIVDALLASPAFGEQWGRHWLDVARYADSVTLRGFVFPEAWRYRNYVIKAFQDDRPFDQLIREQLAGDLYPASTLEARQQQQTGLTFLMLGNTNLEEQDKKALRMDVIDEQLDVITRGFLAQTVTCARCHDHKFDPIPTADYYALASILANIRCLEDANVSQWVEQPLPLPPQEEAMMLAHEAKIRQLQQQIQALKTKSTGKLGPVAVAAVRGIVVDDEEAIAVGRWSRSVSTGVYIGPGYRYSDPQTKTIQTLTFEPKQLPAGRYEVLLAYSHSGSRSAEVPVTIFHAAGETVVPVNMKQSPPHEGRYVRLGEFSFEAAGQKSVLVSTEGTQGHVTADAVVFRSLDATATSPASLPPPGGAGTSAPGKANPQSQTQPLTQPQIQPEGKTGPTLAQLEAQLKQLQAERSRPKLMRPVERPKLESMRIHLRGNVHTLGAPVARGVLRVAAPAEPIRFPDDQSGRRELAEWIASPKNPLTARVYVNRVWHHLFGQGLVRTVDNFGNTGEKPSHPELLDQLAQDFIQKRWSTKALIRQLVLSEVYALSSTPTDAQLKLDPENRGLARANRRWLSAENLRDAMLAVSGQLDRAPAERPFPPQLAADYGYQAETNKRSLYQAYFRNSLPEMISLFNPADPSVTTGARNAGTVAPQALFFMNHPFPQAQAEAMAQRLKADGLASPREQVVRVYQWLFTREPTAKELAVATRYLQAASSADPWPGLILALMASADFRRLD